MVKKSRKRKRLVPTYIIGSIFVVVIVIVAGFSYYWASESLVAKDSEIDSLEEEIRNLQEKFENSVEFTTLYLKANDAIGDAWVNEGTATEYYDWGGYFYDYDNFSGADEYWTYAMDYYYFAAGYYRESKVFFGRAKDLAPTEDYGTVMQKYEELAESGAKIMDYMYEAAEYFASASLYYSQGKWEQGDSALETGNERIASHDAEVPIYNDLLSEIKVIEDLL